VVLSRDSRSAFPATNDQVNPDAASGVDCENGKSAARVERIVRPLFPREGVVFKSPSEEYILTLEQKKQMFKTLFGCSVRSITGALVHRDALGPHMSNVLNELGIETRTFYTLRDGSFFIDRFDK